MKLVLLALAAFVALSFADTGIETVTECPHHPGQCLDSRTGTFHEKNAVWTVPNKCASFKCDFPRIIITGCPVPGVPEGCTLVPQDLSKTYPDCCPHVNCPL